MPGATPLTVSEMPAVLSAWIRRQAHARSRNRSLRKLLRYERGLRRPVLVEARARAVNLSLGLFAHTARLPHLQGRSPLDRLQRGIPV